MTGQGGGRSGRTAPRRRGRVVGGRRCGQGQHRHRGGDGGWGPTGGGSYDGTHTTLGYLSLDNTRLMLRKHMTVGARGKHRNGGGKMGVEHQ